MQKTFLNLSSQKHGLLGVSWRERGSSFISWVVFHVIILSHIFLACSDSIGGLWCLSLWVYLLHRAEIDELSVHWGFCGRSSRSLPRTVEVPVSKRCFNSLKQNKGKCWSHNNTWNYFMAELCVIKFQVSWDSNFHIDK